MLLAFLDELGHSGRYVSRTDPNYQGSPLFGYGGFIIDSKKLRHFVDQIIRQKSYFLNRPIKAVINSEIKASKFIEPNLFSATKPAFARKHVNRLLTKALSLLKEADGKICFYGLEKNFTSTQHDDAVLERTCLRGVLDVLRDEVHRGTNPCVIIVDQHNNHFKKASIISYSMAADGYFRQLAEPPVMADSRASTAIQVADWISGLVNKIHIPLSSKRDEWPELNGYHQKYHEMIMAAALPGSQIVFRAAQAAA